MVRNRQREQAERGTAEEIRREARAAADEVRRETKAAAAEVRVELGAAGRETREALREALAEVRAAFVEDLGTSRATSAEGQGTRLSRAERKEMTRELLLDAAIDVFAEKGYHGASLDDVAEAAGFTKGAVYSNFTRKADLFRALLERETDRSKATRSAALRAAPIELLPDVMGELLRSSGQVGSRDTLMVEFWLAAVRDPSLRDAVAGDRATLGEELDRKLSASDIQPGLDGLELATILEALAQGLLMDRALAPDGDQATLYAKAVHKLIAAEPMGGTGDSDKPR